MENDVMPSIVQMEYGVLKELLTEVKETLATDVKLSEPKKKVFGIVDLWNIRRNNKTASRLYK